MLKCAFNLPPAEEHLAVSDVERVAFEGEFLQQID
jgi:hypothetical protein